MEDGQMEDGQMEDGQMELSQSHTANQELSRTHQVVQELSLSTQTDQELSRQNQADQQKWDSVKLPFNLPVEVFPKLARDRRSNNYEDYKALALAWNNCKAEGTMVIKQDYN